MSAALTATGLTDNDLFLICQAAARLPEIESVILFGSRAKGTYRKGSDVDLAIKGAGATYETAVKLEDSLNEEFPLPYFFDVLDYAAIDEPRLRDHIQRVGITLYKRPADS